MEEKPLVQNDEKFTLEELEKEIDSTINNIQQSIDNVENKIKELSDMKAQLRDKMIYLLGQKDLISSMRKSNTEALNNKEQGVEKDEY